MKKLFGKIFQIFIFVVILASTAGMALTYYKTWSFNKQGPVELEQKLEATN